MPHKLLVIRFSSIGDVVLTTPVIRALKMQYRHGDVELHFLTRARHREILAANPYIDKLHCIEHHISEVYHALQAERFDYVIDLHASLRSFMIKRRLGRPCRTLDKQTLRRFLYVYFKINLLPRRHIVDRYFDVLRDLAVVNDQQGLDYFLSVDDERALTALPASHRRDYLAIVIGGQHAGKRYPFDHLCALCRQIDIPVVLLGGPTDQRRGEAIVQQVGAKVFNACGRFTLNESAVLLREAQCVISNDTGLMHIASAFHKKIISLWGATVPEFGMSPYLPGSGSRILEAVSPQRPYSRHGGKQPFRAAYNCWTGLEPDKILQALR